MPARSRALHAVPPADKPAAAPRRAKPMTLAEAVAGGVYVEILRAQRRDIVASLPEEKGPAKAALHRQLALISKEIQALEEQAKQAASEDAEGASVDDEAWDSEAL